MEFTAVSRLDLTTLVVEVTVPEADESTRYAYYLQEKTRGVIKKQMYLKANTFTFPLSDPGTYTVQVYVRRWPNGPDGDYITAVKQTNWVTHYPTKVIPYEQLEMEDFQSAEGTVYDVVWDGIHYEFFVRYKPDSPQAVILGTGSVIGTKVNPLFVRIAWAQDMPGTAIYYSDPTSYKPPCNLGWGYGTNDRWYLKDIATLLQKILDKLNIPIFNTLFFGSSGGGYTSILLAAMLHSRATVINSQFDVEGYAPAKCVEQLKQVCLKEGEKLLPERTNAAVFFQREGYFPPIHVIQNIRAKKDITTQLAPFLDSLADLSADWSDRLRIDFYADDGGRTAMPSKEDCMKHIREDLAADGSRTAPITAPRRTLSIFGSCVSRDVLAIANDTKFDLKAYIARQSVLSAVAAKIPEDEIPLQNPSAFQLRMVKSDLRKDAFQVLKANQSDYLLLDCIDERFPLLALCGSCVTASFEFYASTAQRYRSARKLEKHVKDGRLYLKDRCVEGAIEEFCARLREIYAPEQIILHYALMVNQYHAKSGQLTPFEPEKISANYCINGIIETIYSRIQAYLPGVHVIREIDGMAADENHKWGLAPMHYQKEYYDRVLGRIYEITGITP